MSHLPSAVLWDMDGTLVDTEPYWFEAEFELAAAYGGTWSREQALDLVGNDLPSTGSYIREHMGIDMEPAAIIDFLLDSVIARVERLVPWRPGAVELLSSIVHAGLPCALVTMSYERLVAPVLAELPESTFAAIVTGDMVSQGKPHPEPYLTAASRLGVDPAGCLAIEDSDTGTRSAVAAGCAVLVVPHQVAVPPGANRTFVDSLVDLDLPRLWGSIRASE